MIGTMKENTMKVLLAKLTLAILLAPLAGHAFSDEPTVVETRQYDCAAEPDCRSMAVAGDPVSADKPFFRGYGDPSVEANGNTLWMSYSWLHNLSTSGKLVGGVETHLAKSIDGGASWQFVTAINSNTPYVGPNSGQPGWLNHEVSTLARIGGKWELVWLTYHKATSGAHDGGTFYQRSIATFPAALGNAVPWLGGSATSPQFGVQHNLSDIPELKACTGFTEPALLVYEGDVYLGMNCMAFGAGGRNVQAEKFFILRQTAAGVEFVADVLSYADAQELGGERVEQVDLFTTASGEVGMLATVVAGDHHSGCHYIKFLNFKKGEIQRHQRTKNAPGKPLATISFTDSKSQPLGHGACTYDAKMTTGVMMVRRVLPPHASGVEFSIMRTGVILD